MFWVVLFIVKLLILRAMFNWFDGFKQLLIERGWLEESVEVQQQRNVQQAQKMMY